MLSGGSTLNSPLSPRLETTSSKKFLSNKVKVLIGFFVFAFVTFVVVALTVILVNTKDVDTENTHAEFQENSQVLHLGGYSICAWEEIPVQDSVIVNGEIMNFSQPLIQGETCDTGEVVILVFGDEGVHGSIGSTRVVADSHYVSHFDDNVEMEGFSVDEETEKTRAREEEWRHNFEKYADLQSSGRRKLLTQGQVDIHLHLDLDQHMTGSLGAYGAAQYAVELIAVVNRDVYYPLGFNLKVVSINLRETYVSQTQSTSAYLDVIQDEGMPENCNLVHSLTTRGLGGGIAYKGGLYYSDAYGYGVSGSLNGGFHKWDLVVVAHELGHNFGADHTHETTPQIDTCGVSCPADPSGGTIMSYCHICTGGLNNVDYIFHEDIKEDILQAYDWYNSNLKERQECTDLEAEIPDIGVPFYLKTDECLDMTGTNPTLCELDSAWVRDSESGAFRLVSFADRELCWEADCASNRIELATCSFSESAQEFEFQGTQLRSVACDAPVTGTDSPALLSLSGNRAVKEWCSPDTPNATPAPTEAIPCDNTNNGATDPYGDDCAWYDNNPSGCGKYDDTDFSSNDMCCSCGGGVNPTEATSEPTLATQEPTFGGVVTQQPSEATPEPSVGGVVTQQPSEEATPEPSVGGVVTQQPSEAGTPSPSMLATQEPSVVVTPQPTTDSSSQCENSNDGATDPWNDDCTWYDAHPWGCGNYNDDDFRSDEMCCVCGGGRNSDGSITTTPVPTPPPVTTTPQPTSPVVDEEFRCYIQDCGCAPFLQSWCDADAHRLTDWCAESESNCQACQGSWCPTGPELTDSPTIASPATTETPTTASPTTASPTTAAPTTASPTTASPTTASPTTGTPTTANPTTESPTMTIVTTEEEEFSYVLADVPLGRTCHNRNRIARHCRGQNSCDVSFCQDLCDGTDGCLFYFHNVRGRCQLFRACDSTRRLSVAGVTMERVL